MRVFKKLGVLLALILCISVIGENATLVYGKNYSNYYDSNTTDDIVITALEWAGIIEPNIEFVIGDITYVVNENNDIEYAISYFSEMLPYGYAVVALEGEDFVVKEGQLIKGKEGLRSIIIDQFDNNNPDKYEQMTISKNIVEIAPLQYGTIMSDGRDTKICDNYGQEYTIYNNENATDGNDLSVNSLSGASTQYDDIDSIYISREEFVYSGKYSVQSSTYLSKYLQRSYLFSESSVEAVTGKYACGVQALLQISYMESLCTAQNSSIKDTYNKYKR